MIILDEATANIDVSTEEKIKSLLRDECHNDTVITIAHRLNTIINNDRVLVLSHGEVAEFGVPAELAADKQSHFAQMLATIQHED